MGALKRKLKTMFTTKRSVMKWVAKRKFFKYLPDKLALKIIYKNYFYKKLNLKNPKTFNEKLQWLKLYDRNPYYKILTNKLLVREEIKKLVGEQYLVKLIGIYNSADEIDFAKLPHQFVLKCSHDSGSVVICRDKSKLNVAQVRERLSKALKCNFWRKGRETAYGSIKKIRPCIVCEEYLYGDDDISQIPDFKFFCFDGEVKVFQVNIGRTSLEGVKVNFYDRDKQRIKMYEHGHLCKDDLDLPDNINEMLALAEKLSKGIPHVRVDLLTYKNKIFFSEYTFYHYGGFVPFEPTETNLMMGDWITLPKKRK